VPVTAARSPGTLAAQVVFALLVAASIGAFFVTTRLKRSTPVVQRLTFARYLSPNGDGRKDAILIHFRTKREDEVSVTIVNENGDEVRTLARDRLLYSGPHRFRWDGRVAGGVPAPDGPYRVRIGLRRQGRSVLSPHRMFVDTTPPNPVVRYVSPDMITPGAVAAKARRANLRFDGPTRSPTLLVYRTDLPRPKLVARRTGRSKSNVMSWDGLAGLGARHRPAAAGDYIMVVRVRDAAGNVGPLGPPRRGRFRGHPGVVVSYLSATGPSGPVRSGTSARFSVAAGGRRYRWQVRRLGSRHRVARGSSRSASLRVRAPRGTTGVFMLDLRLAAHRYSVPFAVQGKGVSHVLVVLPLTTWQAENPLDSNGDGFADVLDEDARVPLRRPIAGHGLPADFAVRESPLLTALDRSGRRYDLTTDLALTRASTRPLVRYAGVLLAGSPRFFPQQAGRILRSYVRAGGRIAWLGGSGLTEPVSVAANELVSAGGGSPHRNLFGERVRDAPGGLLTVLADQIRFFDGVGAAFGPFSSLEETVRLPRGARLLASAGRERRHEALVVYRLGRGVVARLGAEGLGRAAAAGEVAPARIMRRLWTLLGR
jgi:hypothetical protein